tara:strand:- start:12 stop:191 length:180 start_codon:yes stop_codon:yes gene_type:complete
MEVNMKAGALVRLKNKSNYDRYGLVVSILVNDLVGVLWAGTEYVYAEPISLLEVVNEAG